MDVHLNHHEEIIFHFKLSHKDTVIDTTLKGRLTKLLISVNYLNCWLTHCSSGGKSFRITTLPEEKKVLPRYRIFTRVSCFQLIDTSQKQKSFTNVHNRDEDRQN